MDEVAFVESLFAADMRSASTLFPSSTCRVKAAERSPPGSGSSFLVPPPPNSLLGGGITLAQLQPFQAPTVDDAPLFVRLNEDDVFSQMLTDQDFADFHNFKKEQEKPPSSTNSLLLEPLELPRSDPTLKDAFYGVAENYQQFRGLPSSSNFNLESNMMPVYPVATSAQGFYGSYSNYSTMSPASAWMSDHDVSPPGSSTFHRGSMKHLMGLSPSAMLHQHQPSPGAVDMFDPATSQQSMPLWISTSKNSPPEASAKSTDDLKTFVERPPFSLTISPPASLTSNALKELIVSANFEAPSRSKRPRNESDIPTRSKVARTNLQENCKSKANGKTTKGKKCIESGCTRRAQSNSRCKAHGGGARCQYTGSGGCTRSSQGGGFCRAHGGGKRCEFPGCTRGQQRKGRCYVHGGIRKCQFGTCEKKDRGNGFCISHGGGKRCQHPGCSRAVRRGLLCQNHEGHNGDKEQEESVAL